MTKSKLAFDVQYVFSSSNDVNEKQRDAQKNVRSFGTVWKKVEETQSGLLVGLHNALIRQPLSVFANGVTQEVKSLFDLVSNKSLYTSREDIENPGFGFLIELDDWVKVKKPTLTWKEVATPEKKSSKIGHKSIVATAEILRGVLLHNYGKSTDPNQPDVNRDNRKAIIGAWGSFMSKRYNKFTKNALEALYFAGVEIPKELMHLVPDNPNGNPRAKKTIMDRINGNGALVNSEKFTNAMKATGEGKKTEANQAILGCLIGQLGKQIVNAEPSHGGEFVRLCLNNLGQLQKCIVDADKKYRPQK